MLVVEPALLSFMKIIKQAFNMKRCYDTQFIVTPEKGKCIENGKVCTSADKPCCKGLTCKPIGGALLGVCTDKGNIFLFIINLLVLLVKYVHQ